MLMNQAIAASKEAPFPLRRYFYLFVLPGLLLVISTVIFATTETVRSSTVEILLQLASRRVEGLAKGLESVAPVAWHKLTSNEPLTELDLVDLNKGFALEQGVAQIALLKVYSPDRKTVYATEADEIGKIEDKPELRNALVSGTASVLVERDIQGGAFYELYLPYRSGGRVAVVFELYEQIAGFDALVWNVIRPLLLVPIALFVVMLATLAWLVGRAQADINYRTDLVISLRRRLERLVSHKAVAAMRTGRAERNHAELLEVTLFYSDVRGFTGFAEQHTPNEVIGFLNRIIGLQVGIIEARGGDVDKMIGDAVLARFHGPERAIRAVAAAISVQNAIKSAGLPHGVAIGLFDGPVVAGLIGAGDRLDYTVVGDSVNTAARLCGLAQADEIVAESTTLATTKEVNFGPDERVRVKGRAAELTVRRLKCHS